MKKLFKRKKEINQYIPEKTRKEYRIALLPNMSGKMDFYTDGKGLVYIADKDCDFNSKDEFIKMGLIEKEDTVDKLDNNIDFETGGSTYIVKIEEKEI